MPPVAQQFRPGPIIIRLDIGSDTAAFRLAQALGGGIAQVTAFVNLGGSHIRVDLAGQLTGRLLQLSGRREAEEAFIHRMAGYDARIFGSGLRFAFITLQCA